MDQIRTYISGIAHGLDSAFRNLDRQAEELTSANVTIVSVKDRYFCRAGITNPDTQARPGQDELVTRTIVYRK